MNTKFLAALALFAAIASTLSAWADVEILGADGSVTLTDNVTIEKCGDLIVSNTIDLAGHNLTIKGVTMIKWGDGATFTSSGDTTGVLWIEHSGDVSQTNAFSGKLKFIKDGTGTWTLPKVASYSGGTEVRDGRLVAETGSTRKFQATCLPFGTGSNLDIYGGTLESKGYTTWDFKNYCVNMHGGTFENTVQQDNTTAFNAPLTVWADSTFIVGKGTDNKGKIYNIVGAVDLKGNTLHVELTNTLRFKPVSITAGSLNVTGKDKSFQLEDDIEASGVNLTMGATLALNAKTFDVGNFTLTSDGAVSGEGSLRVHGTYAPSAADAYYPKMMAGSTLDLSGLSGAAELAAANFDSGTVTIALGDRLLASGQQIVAWTAKPAGVEFIFTGSNIEAGKTFSVSDSGIVYDAKSDAIASAVWTGAGVSGNWTDPQNWICKNADGDVLENAVPTSDMRVTFTGDVSGILFDGFPFASAHFTEAYLSQPTTWSTFDINKMSDDSVLDLRGNGLALSSLSGACTTTATITNSLARASLDFVVSAGNIYSNGTLNLVGNLDVVKKGEGILVAIKNPQEYDGVTIVSNGVLRCAAAANINTVEKKSPFGAQCRVEVGPEGVLDPAGSYAWSYHTIVMDGGSISNTVEQMGTKNSAYNVAAKNMLYPFNPVINLAADAELISPCSFNFFGVVKGNGHKLTVHIEDDMRWSPQNSDRPIFEFFGKGNMKTLSNFPMNIPTATLIMNGPKFDVGGSMTLSNYTACSLTAISESRNADARMNVFGTFTSTSSHFFGCTMQNGSTIDLSTQEQPWSTKGGEKGKTTVDFAPSATVTIDVHGRTFERKTQVVQWESGSTNGLDTVQFKIDAVSKAAGYDLFYQPYVNADNKGGLWAGRKGFVVTFH